MASAAEIAWALEPMPRLEEVDALARVLGQSVETLFAEERRATAPVEAIAG